MDTTPDGYNAAVAKIIDLRKHELGMTYDTLEEASGVNVRTLKRLVTGERPFKMGQFFAVATALGLDPADVVSQVEAALALENSRP